MDTSSNNTDTEILIPYHLCRMSGTLDFWDDKAEDIYTDEDGEPIERTYE